MAKNVCIATQKGGTGKTSTAHILALGLAHKGARVLIVDLDPQTNLTLAAGADENEPTLYEVLTGDAKIQEAIVKGELVDIVPGSEDLAGADLEFNKTGREYLLQEALDPVKKAYDFIIMDCPAALGLLTVNALTASDRVIIPCGADLFNIQGFSQLYATIKDVQKYSNKKLKIAGLLVTRIRSGVKLSREFSEELDRITKKEKIRLFKTQIREAVAIPRYQAEGTDPFITEKRAAVMADYNEFINEFMEG